MENFREAAKNSVNHIPICNANSITALNLTNSWFWIQGLWNIWRKKWTRGLICTRMQFRSDVCLPSIPVLYISFWSEYLYFSSFWFTIFVFLFELLRKLIDERSEDAKIAYLKLVLLTYGWIAAIHLYCSSYMLSRRRTTIFQKYLVFQFTSVQRGLYWYCTENSPRWKCNNQRTV